MYGLRIKEKNMSAVTQTRVFVAILILACILPGVASAAPKKSSGASAEMLEQYVADLQKNPGDKALREKIIRLALSMKPAPAVPEDAERNMARGVVFFTKATDSTGYRKAIAEFEAATNAAPWLDKAYYNLGVAQEKEGMYKEAIKNLKLYLLADPNARNAREVRNQIYMLEANVEEAQAAPGTTAVPGAAAAPPAAAPGVAVAKPTPLLGTKSELDIEKDLPLKVVKLPPRTRSPGYRALSAAGPLRSSEALKKRSFRVSRS